MGKYLALGHSARTSLRSVRTPWPRAKYLPIRPFHLVNKYILATGRRFKRGRFKRELFVIRISFHSIPFVKREPFYDCSDEDSKGDVSSASPSSFAFHFILFYSIPFHSILFHSISFNSIPFVKRQPLVMRSISLHFISFHSIPLYFIPFHCIPFHSIHYITLHSIPFRFIPIKIKINK